MDIILTILVTLIAFRVSFDTLDAYFEGWIEGFEAALLIFMAFVVATLIIVGLM
jgi:hypothetical protein